MKYHDFTLLGVDEPLLFATVIGLAMQEKIVHLLIHPFFPPIPSKNYRAYMENLHYP
jgi:hypothetical protein